MPPVPPAIPALRVLLLVPALMLMLAGCGGGGDDDGGDSAGTRTPTATTTAPTATTTVAPQTPQTPQTERERVGDCLRELGYRLTGGAPKTKDSETADYQIILVGPPGSGYIGFYENASRAQRVAKRLRRNLRRSSGGSVERRGSINIAWVALADSAARDSVRGCLVT